MTDSTLNRFVAYGTAAERAAFTPVPPTPASGPNPLYIWYETDTGDTYVYDTGWTILTAAATIPDPIVPADGTQNITGNLVASGTVGGSNLSGTNTGDQTSIVGITGTIAQFNTACSDADFATGGGTATGTNTGDQTITLTGNVTGSGTGSFATTIAASAVTLAMQADMATASVVYRKTAGAGAPEVQTLATLKTDLGLTGTNSGDQTITLTSDVTGSGTGSFATTIAAGVVTLAKMADIATDRLIGRDTAATGVPEAITVGGGIEFTGTGGIQTSAFTGDVTKSAGGTATTIANNAVSFAKFVAAPSVGIVWATGAGNYSHNASGGGTANFLRADGTWAAPGGSGTVTTTGTPASGNLTAFSGATSITNSNLSGDVTTSGTLATTIANDVVTFAKMQNSSVASRLVGRGSASGAGDFEEITLGTNLSMSGTTLNATGGGSVAWGAITGTLSSQTDLQSALDLKAPLASPTFTGTVTTAASATGGAGLNLPHGAAPTTPNNGDLWTTTTGAFVQVNGSTVGLNYIDLSLPWSFSTSTTNADPGTGVFRLNNVTLASVTAIYLDDFSSTGRNIDTILGLLATGNRITILGDTTSTHAAVFEVSGALTDNVGYWTIPVTVVDSNVLFSASEICTFVFDMSVAGGGTTPTGTGFVHITAGAQDAASKLVDTADINDAQVTYAKIQNVGALAVVGNATNGAAVATSVTATNDGNVLRRSGTTLGFGAIDLSLAGSAVQGDLAFSNIAQIATDRLLGRDTAATGDIETLTVGGGIEFTGAGGIQRSALTGDVTATAGSNATTIANGVVSGAKLTANGQVRCITFIIDGGGSAITTGVKGDLEIPFACTITGWTLLLDQSGSIVIDIWKDTYANYPPTVADTITASDKPTVSATTKGQDLAPTGWTTAITAGDTLRFNVDSITTATRAVLSIRVNVT